MPTPDGVKDYSDRDGLATTCLVDGVVPDGEPACVRNKKDLRGYGSNGRKCLYFRNNTTGRCDWCVAFEEEEE